ncbi:MAG: hypothetical protein R3E79_18185 [Caldilineaceae bacterium]
MLRRNLEETLDLPKEDWPLPLLRTLADTFLEVSEQRKISAEYEMRWYNLAGFCLRPGYGDSLDEWRMKEVWKLQLQGLSFGRQVQNRRVVGFLATGRRWAECGTAAADLPAGASISLPTRNRKRAKPVWRLLGRRRRAGILDDAGQPGMAGA